jgi:hypothetical protein
VFPERSSSAVAACKLRPAVHASLGECESPALSARLMAARPQPSFLRLAEPAAM